mmetsp:Transcript_101726/g.217819  ORF Transcript_101726/g.217819 Transcript_101726/m.217819 type:complete len:519 (-) Transcript_101726:79-1635(-)
MDEPVERNSSVLSLLPEKWNEWKEKVEGQLGEAKVIMAPKGISQEVEDPGAALKDREAAVNSVRLLDEETRERRCQYISRTTDDLRAECDRRNLMFTNDMDRWTLIKLLEQEDSLEVKWVEGRAWEGFSALVVVLNAVVIGIEIDHPAYFPVYDFLIINSVFLVFFILEIVVKIEVLGYAKYAKDPWNLFDVIVTVLVCVQMSATYSSISGHIYDHMLNYVAADFTQILRLCRLFRLARVFKELGVLIRSFLMSIRALGWIFVLLLLWFYLSACITTIFIGRREGMANENQEEVSALRAKFKTIPLSMFALFEVMTLEGWSDNVRPLIHTRLHMVFFFLIFIFVTAFFMLNLVTAVVVDRTVAAQEELEEGVIQEQMQQRNARISLMCAVLKEWNSDADDPDLISREDFNTAMADNPELDETMEELGLSRKQMNSMFGCAEHDGEERTSISNLQRLVEVSDRPLDTANYVRFQIEMSHRLEYQEKLTMTVLHALETLAQQKFEVPEHPSGKTLESKLK